MSNQERSDPGESLPLQTIPRRQARHKCGALWLSGADRMGGVGCVAAVGRPCRRLGACFRRAPKPR